MIAPQKSETPLAGGVVAKQSTDAQIVADSGDDNKAVASIIARFAMLGHCVHRLADGGYLIARWGTSMHCPDAAALGAFLAQIGGRL